MSYQYSSAFQTNMIQAHSLALQLAAPALKMNITLEPDSVKWRASDDRRESDIQERGLNMSTGSRTESRPSFLPGRTGTLSPFGSTASGISGGGKRLPPTVVTRMPLPIQNLPTLVGKGSGEANSAPRRPSLRSMPSLPMEGQEDIDDGDNESMEDIAEYEDEEEHEEEEESGIVDSPSAIDSELERTSEETRSRRSSSSERNMPGKGNADRRIQSPRVTLQSTSPARDPSSTPPVDISSASLNASVPTPSRPSFYRHQSRSLSNLPLLSPPPRPPLPLSMPPNPLPPLRRRTSMPNINSKLPPPYAPPDIFSASSMHRTRSTPREDEGMEHLPPYQLTIPLLAALLPRKLEFSSPGKLAPDRRWRRVWCVLEGTSFKVYEPDKGWRRLESWLGRQRNASSSSSIRKGKQRCSDGDTIKISAISPEELNNQDRQKYMYAVSGTPPGQRYPAESDSNSPTGSLLRPPESAGTGRTSFSSMRSHYPTSSRTSLSSAQAPSSMDSPPPHLNHPQTDTQKHRRSLSRTLLNLKPSHGSVSSDGHIELPRSPSRPPKSQIDDPCGDSQVYIASITSRQLLRHYTLQKAESGVAIDYVKRQHVIRVRMEGEQFLLQVQGPKQVVEWIEGFQSASDIALDLDERIMPRGPIFPRRRRRRRPGPESTSRVSPSGDPSSSSA